MGVGALAPTPVPCNAVDGSWRFSAYSRPMQSGRCELALQRLLPSHAKQSIRVSASTLTPIHERWYGRGAIANRAILFVFDDSPASLLLWRRMPQFNIACHEIETFADESDTRRLEVSPRRQMDPQANAGALWTDGRALPSTPKARKKAQSPREAGFVTCIPGGSRARRPRQLSVGRRRSRASAGLYTLNRKFITSPSCTTYSLPSARILPASFAPCSPL